jgi:type II secretory pathway pseudopilin PulG
VCDVDVDSARGFTTLEAVVAIALVILSAASVASLFVASARSVGSSRSTTIAALLAREKLEQLRAVPFDDPALIPAALDSLSVDVDGYADVPAAGFRRRWSITPLPMYPASSLILQVTVLHGTDTPLRVATIRSRKVS